MSELSLKKKKKKEEEMKGGLRRAGGCEDARLIKHRGDEQRGRGRKIKDGTYQQHACFTAFLIQPLLLLMELMLGLYLFSGRRG